MTDTKQPEALRLADFFETDSSSTFAEFRAATELRRLHKVNAELLAALKEMCSYTAELNPNQGFDGFDHCAVNKAQAAIAKAEDTK
jgi:hypothetical protein